MKSKNTILRQIEHQSIVEPVDIVNSCILRCCFDTSSTEWHDSTMDEKVEALKKLINEDDEDTFRLSLGMMDYCNSDADKEIKPIDLLVSMSKIIDHLLKEKV